jgi:Cu(I)/Ag(I) efflux system protein CusF
MKHEWILAAVLLTAFVPAASAADAKAGKEASAKPAAAVMTAGEVKKVDLEAKKLTIKHGPIENLKMPPMTMVFRVKDPAMLAGLDAGTKIRFHAEEVDGGYLVTKLQKAK